MAGTSASRATSGPASVRPFVSTFLLLATGRRTLGEVTDRVVLTGELERAAAFVQAMSFSV